MLTRVSSAENHEDIIGNSTDPFPPNDDVLSDITQFCVTIGITFITFLSVVVIGTGNAIFGLLMSGSAGLARWLFSFLVQNVPCCSGSCYRCCCSWSSCR